MNQETNEAPGFCRAIDTFITRVGRLISWLAAVLIVVIIVQVILRYVFGRGLVVLEDFPMPSSMTLTFGWTFFMIDFPGEERKSLRFLEF